MIKSKGIWKPSLPFITLPLWSCSHPKKISLSTLPPIWSSCRLHFLLFISASSCPFSLFHWYRLLHFQWTQLYKKYTSVSSLLISFLVSSLCKSWWPLQMFCRCFGLILGPSFFFFLCNLPPYCYSNWSCDLPLSFVIFQVN